MFTFSQVFDLTGNASSRSVQSNEIFFAKDKNDNLLATSDSTLTYIDGSYWRLPSGLSGGAGDDSYSVGYNTFAVIADAGFGTDKLKIFRELSNATHALRVDNRHLVVRFELFPGSQYITDVLIIDAFKPEGSIETITFDNNVIVNAAYDKLIPLISSSGIRFEDLSWDQAIAKKYCNLGTLGVSNNSAGADELMDVLYKTGNPITEAGVHRFFNPSKGVHFYSNDLNEINNVRSRLSNYWYEGKVYDPITGSATGSTQLYRFFNAKASYHFMTTSATEAAVVNNNPSWGYQQEGRAFTVSTQASADAQTPVYRFFRVMDGAGQHFYTSSEAERQNILNNPSWGYQQEGIAWYAK